MSNFFEHFGKITLHLLVLKDPECVKHPHLFGILFFLIFLELLYDDRGSLRLVQLQCFQTPNKDN